MRNAFSTGAAAERFDRMVAALGGPTDFLDDFEQPPPRRPDASPTIDGRTRPASSPRIDTRALGLAVVELGGGRRRATDPIDHAVGLELLLGLGASVEPDTPLARIHAADAAGARRGAEARMRAAYRIADDRRPPRRRSILGRIA